MMVMVSGIATDTPESADPSCRPLDADTDEDSACDDAKRWPASMAWVASSCCPRTLALRTNHITLSRALLFQLLVGVVVALTIPLLTCLSDTESFGLRDVSRAFQDRLLGLWLEVGGTWPMALLAIIVVALLIEVCVFMLAALLMPWGARDELLRDSYKSSLRRTMLQLTQVLPAVLFVGGSVIVLERGEAHWKHTYFRPEPRPPTAPAIRDPNSAEGKAFQLERQDYNRAHWKWYSDLRRVLPWYFKNKVTPISILVAGSVCWLIWGLLRGVAAPRPATPMARPPTCETCGYNLTATKMDGRCPECGEFVERSLGAQVRPGTAWQRRATMGSWVAGWRTTAVLLTDPKGFGRRIVVSDSGTDHRRFFALHLPLVFLIVPVGMLALFMIATNESPEVWLVLPIVAMLGSFALMCAMGVSLVSALVVSLWYQHHDGRNLLSATMQIACYLAPVVVSCEVVCVLSMVLVFFLADSHYLDALQELTRISERMWGMLIWGTPVAIATIYYLSLLVRATAGARFANR